jgi:hypothetical protein
LAVSLTVQHPRRGINLPLSDAHLDLEIASDVLNPSSRFTRFGEQIETLTGDNKPNLDLARQTGATTHCGEIKHRLVRNTLKGRQF